MPILFKVYGKPQIPGDRFKMKIDVKEDRKEIERIIRINLPLMNKNEGMCQEVADAILLHFIEKEKKQ